MKITSTNLMFPFSDLHVVYISHWSIVPRYYNFIQPCICMTSTIFFFKQSVFFFRSLVLWILIAILVEETLELFVYTRECQLTACITSRNDWKKVQFKPLKHSSFLTHQRISSRRIIHTESRLLDSLRSWKLFCSLKTFPYLHTIRNHLKSCRQYKHETIHSYQVFTLSDMKSPAYIVHYALLSFFFLLTFGCYIHCVKIY